MDINVDKIKDSLDKATAFTVKKTTKLVSFAKTKVKKAELRSDITDGYIEIGKLLYNASKTDEDVSEKIGEIIDKLGELHQELETLTEQGEKEDEETI